MIHIYLFVKVEHDNCNFVQKHENVSSPVLFGLMLRKTEAGLVVPQVNSPPGQLALGSTRPRVSSPRPIHMFIGDVISTGVIMHQSFVSTAPLPMGMGDDNGFSFFRALV